MNTTRRFRFDAEKALEIILYISSRAPIPDIYHVGKIVYYADRHHLEDFGRLTCGDEYCAMRDGPVPSGTYDLIKDVRDLSRTSMYADQARQTFAVEGVNLVPFRKPNEKFLSESDKECLDMAIKEVGNLSYSALKRKSHDKAYESADLNGEITLEAIAATLPSGQNLIEQLRDP
jgi:uncharacterized phage-associated protein